MKGPRTKQAAGAGKAGSVQPAAVRITERFAMEGLDCADCGAEMRAALRQLGGIQTVAINVPNQAIDVTFDPTRTDVVSIKAHMQSVGIGCK